MILVGNQRGGARDLAQHLMKTENDRVQVAEIRGFLAQDLAGAFVEAHAISKGTRCSQFLFSLSLNPPKGADVSDKAFFAAIDQAETKLGLTGQPRAVVFHEKRGIDGEARRCACRLFWDLVLWGSALSAALALDHPPLRLEGGWRCRSRCRWLRLARSGWVDPRI